jgi:hypothetical protein
MLQPNINLFDYVSYPTDKGYKIYETEFVDYMVNSYPRTENLAAFNYVHGLFHYKPIAFAHNQEVIIHIANEMFAETQPLSAFESHVLNKTLSRTLQTKPTLSGRK